MSLIPTLSFLEVLAAIPLVVVLGPLVLSLVQGLMANPVVNAAVNATLVVLKSTEVVWRPIWTMSLVAFKQVFAALVYIAPMVKAVVMTIVNATVNAVRTAQQMGVSFSSAFPTLMLRIKELGEALLVIARTLGVAAYYAVKGLSLLLGSFEKVFVFGKQLLFEAHLLSAHDLYNVMLPLAIVFVTSAVLYWLRKAPSVGGETCEKTFQPRRSSRLARKRAMLYAQDLDLSPACKKSSAAAANL